MGSFLLIGLLSNVIWISIVVWVIRAVLHRRNAKSSIKGEMDWSLSFVYSEKDLVSQGFILAGILYISVTILSLFRNADPQILVPLVILFGSVLSFTAAQMLKSPYAFTCGLIGSVSWFMIQGAIWLEETGTAKVSLLTGLMLIAVLLFAAGHLIDSGVKTKFYSYICKRFGSLTLLIVLFALSMKSGLMLLVTALQGTSLFTNIPMMVMLFVILVASSGVVFQAFNTGKMLMFELLGILGCSLIAIVLLLLRTVELFEKGSRSYFALDTLTPAGFVYSVIFNIAICVYLGWVLYSGYLRHEVWMVNMASFTLFIFVFVKYFDWFFSLMDKGLFFIIAGLLFVGFGYFMERGRRKMVEIAVLGTGMQSGVTS